MTPTDTHNTYRKILSNLSQGRLKNAIEGAEALNLELQSPVHSETLNNMQQSYRYMLQYFMDGVDDPERKSVHNKLITRLFLLACELRDDLLTRDSNNYEFSQKRYFPFLPQLSYNTLKESINRKEQIAEIQELETIDASKKINQVELQFEIALRYLFNYFWLKSHYDSLEIMEIYHMAMDDRNDDLVLKSMLVSAITLNLWRTFDETKVLLLLDACKSSELYARQRALIGLCFILAKYNRFLPYFPAIRNRLVLMADDLNIVENLQNIIIQIIATTETEQISKRLQEEIFPELIKLHPMIDKGMNNNELFNTDEWGEMNPDWQEMIENSGVSDKLQEFAEMEMSGADVYMSTFSMLKSYPFFNEFSNWFLPFDTENSAVSPLFSDGEKTLMSTFVNSNVMCNSDRYSFSISVLQMPELQRNLMKQSFNEAASQMEEMNKDEAILSPNVAAKSISKHYIQDLFRFFKLNQYRNDFADMFGTSLIMHKTYLFDLLSIDNTIKSNIAEYYFSKRLYPQALELFKELENEGETSAALYQKIGYAYQQTSQLFQALEAYKKADLLQPDDFWTNRKMALCYRLTGNTDKALELYKHAGFIKPENLSVRLQMVSCLVEQKKYDAALKELITLNEEFPDNSKVLRTIMNSSFAAKNLAQANYFSSLLIENKDITMQDLITAGHINWCMNKHQNAKNLYNRALQKIENNWDVFVKAFKQDRDLLAAYGVDEEELPLILDAISYNLPPKTELV